MSVVDNGTVRAGDNLVDTDHKDQIYELQALESIFSGTPECFSYHHQQQAPDPKITGSITIVLAKFDKEITIHADSKTVRISYLPPLFLYFTFPQDYPSCSMPKFSLRADWLDSNMNEGLSKILTNAWTDCCGMPVLFTWIELLKEEATRLIISKSDIHLKDVLAGGQNAVQPSLKAFIEYNEKAVQKDFEDDWYDCEVCYTSKSGKDCLKFLPCGHIFCSECTSEYYRQRMRENLLRHFGCLDDGCESVATQAQIRQVLTKKEYEVYEQRLLEGTLDLMSDVVICPRISCQAPVIIDGGTSNLASCSLCRYSFCTLCRKAYHGVDSCKLSSELRDKLLDQFENATPAQLEDIYKRFGGREQVERQIQALKSEQWIASNSKACPSCRANIEKNDGCNKMTCTKCGHYFCWLCGTELDRKDPYSHFNMPGSKRCFNRLFEGMVETEDEDEWVDSGSEDGDDFDDETDD